MIDFWIRESDNKTLAFAYDTDMRLYSQTYLTGEIDDPGSLAKVRKYFTLARWRLWKPEDTKQEYDFVHVKSATLYPQGVVFTPFTANDIQLDHRALLIHRKERIELMGSDGDDFPPRFFKTYTGLFKTQQVKDWHAFLYRSGVGKFIVDVPGSFPIEELDGLLRKEGVLMDEGVSGSKYMGIQSVNGRRLVFTNWEHHVEESGQKLPGYIESFIEKNAG